MIVYISDNAGIIGLLFFVSIFMVIAAWAFKPSNKGLIESYKYIPLAEENNDLR